MARLAALLTEGANSCKRVHQMQGGQQADCLLAQLIDIGYGCEAASAAISATRSAGWFVGATITLHWAVTPWTSGFKHAAPVTGLQACSRRCSGCLTTRTLERIRTGCQSSSIFSTGQQTQRPRRVRCRYIPLPGTAAPPDDTRAQTVGCCGFPRISQCPTPPECTGSQRVLQPARPRPRTGGSGAGRCTAAIRRSALRPAAAPANRLVSSGA